MKPRTSALIYTTIIFIIILNIIEGNQPQKFPKHNTDKNKVNCSNEAKEKKNPKKITR